MTEPLKPEPTLTYDSVQRRVSGFALTSFILGLLAIPLDIAYCFGSSLGILAIIFGGVALGQIRRDPTLKGKAFALTGIILGAISLLLAIGCGLYLFAAIRS